MSIERWPVWSAMARSLAPSEAAVVANPARNELPDSATVSRCARSAQRFTIRLTAPPCKLLPWFAVTIHGPKQCTVVEVRSVKPSVDRSHRAGVPIAAMRQRD